MKRKNDSRDTKKTRQRKDSPVRQAAEPVIKVASRVLSLLPGQPPPRFTTSTMAAHGSYKTVWNINENPNMLLISFRPVEGFHDARQAQIIRENFDEQRVLEEIKLYYELGNARMCPRIPYAYVNYEAISLNEFLRSGQITIGTQFIIEKFDCHRDILSYFMHRGTFDAVRFFRELRMFFSRLVTKGYYNRDIKLANLCYQRDLGFVMIDMDFVSQVISDSEEHCISFMILLVYMTTESHVPIRLDQTGVTKEQYADMFAFFIEHTRGRYNPIEMICHYSTKYVALDYDRARHRGVGLEYLKEYLDTLDGTSSPTAIRQMTRQELPTPFVPVHKFNDFGWILAVAILGAAKYYLGGTRKKKKSIYYVTSQKNT